jgi:hypothetical protein
MKLIRNTFILIAALAINSCSDVLELKPLDKLDSETLFSDPEGVKVYLANLYYQMPVEDFTFFFNGFNINTGDPNNSGIAPAIQTDEAIGSEFGGLSPWGSGDFAWWEEGYNLIRDVNLLIETIPALDITEEEKQTLRGESAFIRAFAYFALAKRYGGVPLITQVQNYEGEVENLKVPRSTEKETWDFVLQESDIAIENLPESWSGGERRATKWVAYALKSRVALHAASLAKYGHKAPLSGTAVDEKLIGLEASEANYYYEACIKASEAIMNAESFALYRPNPANPQEAAENYRSLFEDPNNAPEEVIFIKGYTIPGTGTGHNYDIWYNPNQTSNGWPHPGRMNPSLELVDTYESYTNPGEPSPIVTTLDGSVGDNVDFDRNKAYKRFDTDTPYNIFEDKDARLWGTLILPGTTWKGKTIIIQGGFVQPDGTAKIETNESITHNGVTYYTYGAPDWTQYSGFDTHAGNMTRTGFGFKKFLQSDEDVTPAWNQSTTDWIAFRYAEILLNYAEAVVEINYTADNAQARAAEAINSIRRRAAHTVDIPLTLENVLRERKIELAFENKRYWDLIRRRDYHLLFNNSVKHALVPLLDLRVDPVQYIFVRKEVSRGNPLTFAPHLYYRPIPGIGSNDLVQNPQY